MPQLSPARVIEALPQLLTCFVTLLSGVMAAQFLGDDFSSALITLGLDPLRAQMLTALLLSTLAASLGALIGSRQGGALVGAGSFFCWYYLLGFVQAAQQPVHDPLGNLEPLDVSTLVHTGLMMLALALLAAFIGAAVGCSLNELISNPLVHLVGLLRRRMHMKQHGLLVEDFSEKIKWTRTGNRPGNAITSWLALLSFALLVVLAAGSSDLFLYAPDTGLHTAPLIHTGTGHQVFTTGTLVADSVVSSALGGQKKPFLVYLPPSYNTPQGRLKRYPTLYLLHGSPGSDSDWVTGGKVVQAANTLIEIGKMEETILILPDGNGRRGQTSEWGNSGDHSQNMETYIVRDLVNYVDSKYRTIASSNERGIGGLSMGGFGAMNIALHYPSIFGYVIALGGYYRAEGSIWGKNPAYLRANSPLYVLPTDKGAWHLHFYLGAATKDQPYYTDTMQFVQELKSLHLPYTLDIKPGYHSWRVWQIQIYDALPWLHWGR